MQITSLTKTTWIRERFERPKALDCSNEEKKLILERLTRATGFENFLAKKFSSEKRFGLEGCDIMIPVIKEVVDNATKDGAESIFIGMAHRGRLNVLANVCRKPMADILAQFHGLQASDSGSGDVKYHLGVFQERLNRQTNRMVRITVVANPSHLEHVNPILLGKARAEMVHRGDTDGEKVLPIIVHGDASFCGQGVVFESMHLSDLPHYTTHGTIHIVSNNQVGFTTDPRFSRSSRYCTDVAKVVMAPILHVNADDPEACIQCARIAAAYRATFKKDVVIDIVGYRRNGHNEADEPMFTQPLMYQRIRKLKPCLTLYAEKLIKEGVLTDSEYKEMVAKYDKICEDAWTESKNLKTIKYSTWIDSPWSAYFEGRNRLKMEPTGVHEDTLKKIGSKFSSLPPPEHKFEAHKGIQRILSLRQQMVDDKVADWSLGEAFAFGTLLKEGVHVRLSGQDVERGTFSHRHHVLHHQSADKVVYSPLNHLYPDQAQYSVSNSSLSECAVLGFEHGYSMASPNTLVMWEGQFGDFCNTAQCIIDQFIASGESKWVRQSGVVLLLPHSMEGMGPEHSSGRIERFLQMSDDDPDIYPNTCDCDFVARQLMDVNWIVTNLSTPANFFHCLRRQVKMGFRKPLINFSPKSVLRHPMARSPFKDFNEASSFHRIIPDSGSKNPNNVTKLVFCSGKVYYDLVKEREDHEQEETVAIVRVEQLCPFPYDLISEQLDYYSNAELIWAQEEHKNSGAWFYVQPRFDTALLHNKKETRCVTYHGRPPSSSPATGNKVQHYKEYKAIIEGIFGELTEENQARLNCIIKEQQAKAKAEKDSMNKSKPQQPVKPKSGATPPSKGKSPDQKPTPPASGAKNPKGKSPDQKPSASAPDAKNPKAGAMPPAKNKSPDKKHLKPEPADKGISNVVPGETPSPDATYPRGGAMPPAKTISQDKNQWRPLPAGKGGISSAVPGETPSPDAKNPRGGATPPAKNISQDKNQLKPEPAGKGGISNAVPGETPSPDAKNPSTGATPLTENKSPDEKQSKPEPAGTGGISSAVPGETPSPAAKNPKGGATPPAENKSPDDKQSKPEPAGTGGISSAVPGETPSPAAKNPKDGATPSPENRSPDENQSKPENAGTGGISVADLRREPAPAPKETPAGPSNAARIMPKKPRFIKLSPSPFRDVTKKKRMQDKEQTEDTEKPREPEF
ncbi:hypothetical protein KR032_011983 [Drosophila birchii]|nr:hypothetical protein KR032_011983 [Drosophila birchii]